MTLLHSVVLGVSLLALTTGVAAISLTTGAWTPPSFSTLLAASEDSEKSTKDADTWSSDTTKPKITIMTPENGATYALNEHVEAAAVCTDERKGSGMASCVGSIANGDPIDTGSASGRNFKVEATDNAGNTHSVTHTYTVVDNDECTILGTKGDDELVGTSDNDIICGLGGDDIIEGGDGNDTLKGGDGDDTLRGGAGHKDELIGGEGRNTLDGGPGDHDTASYRSSAKAVEASLISLSATGEGFDKLVEIEDLKGSNYDDELTGSYKRNRLAGFGGSDVLSGFGEDDILWSGKGRDTLLGGSGDDQLVGEGGPDELFGEDGDDTIQSEDDESGNDSLDGGAGSNTCTTDTTEKSITDCDWQDS
jgi:Ca2+-binding RTX toxin-like protein